MKKLDWSTMPYDHKGRWHKKFQSIMNPSGDKITFPQLVAEFVIYWRTELLKDYQNIKYGPEWYLPIQAQVRNLNQQACAICNYFPHPDDEGLVIVAFKNVFRKLRPLTIGGFRKTRKTKSGKINITQAEKDILNALQCELERLIEQRNIFISVSTDDKKIEPSVKKEVTFNSSKVTSKPKNPLSFANEEKNIR